MKPEDRALVLLIVGVVVVATAGLLYVVVLAGNVPTNLPIPAGTVFTANETQHWVAHFTVGPLGGRLTGAWTAYSGSGFITLVVVNGTVDKPWPPPPLMCPLLYSWTEQNGTVNDALGPGAYSVYWSTGYCSSVDRIVVTQPITLAPS